MQESQTYSANLLINNICTIVGLLMATAPWQWKSNIWQVPYSSYCYGIICNHALLINDTHILSLFCLFKLLLYYTYIYIVVVLWKVNSNFFLKVSFWGPKPSSWTSESFRTSSSHLWLFLVCEIIGIYVAHFISISHLTTVPKIPMTYTKKQNLNSSW